MRMCVRVMAVVMLTITASPLWAQGTFLRGVGAVNESMGGAAVAAPIDAAGTIYWNPAAISGMSCNMMSIDLGLMMPKSSVQFGGEKSDSEAGQVPAPTMAMVWHPKKNSRITTGLFMGAVGGSAALYPASGSPANVNPIFGTHAKASNVQVLEVIPTVSYQITNRVSIGLSPVIALAQANLNPMPLGMPLATPLTNYGTSYTWGGGFNFGIYYEINDSWRAGFSIKSPVWAEPLKFVGTQGGVARNASMKLDLPMVISWGLSYDGFSDTIIAADIRYFNFAGTTGLGGNVVDGGGVVRNLGWEDSMSLALGVQRKLGHRMIGRMGYTFSTNPIPERSQYANVGSPLMIEHVLAFGGTFIVVEGLELNAVWAHAFETSRSGPFAGNTVTNTVSANTLIAGVTKKW